MKKLFHLFACAAIGVMAVAMTTGCSDKKDDPASEIVISGDANVAVIKTGEPKTITFSSNYDWSAKATLTPTGDWCTITPATGKAGAVCTITVTVAANGTETERTAVISITTTKEPNLPKEVKFTQAANTDPKDVTVKINATTNKIIHDRNLGSTKIGELGKWYTYAEAVTACPKGYHTMSVYDYLDLIYYNNIFETRAKLKDGALKMPVEGGYYDGSNLVKTTDAYYWLDGSHPDFGISPTDAEAYAIETVEDQGFLLAPYYPDYKTSFKMQVRCVKD